MAGEVAPHDAPVRLSAYERRTGKLLRPRKYSGFSAANVYGPAWRPMKIRFPLSVKVALWLALNLLLLAAAHLHPRAPGGH